MQRWMKLKLCSQTTVLSIAPWQISSLPFRSAAFPMRLVAAKPSGFVSSVSMYLSPYMISYHFQSITGPPATPTLKV